MVSKKNYKLLQQRNAEKIKQRWALRKCTVGVASILLGTTIFFGSTAIAHADTTGNINTNQTENKVIHIVKLQKINQSKTDNNILVNNQDKQQVTNDIIKSTVVQINMVNTNQVQPVIAKTQTNNAQKELPQTGNHSSSTAIIGLGLVAGLLSLLGIKKKQND